MTIPTEKQISFAYSLGISNAETYSKEELSKLINDRAGQKKASNFKQNPSFSSQNSKPSAPAPQEAVTQSLVINRTEKPNSYEFGKASARHKIYYNEVGELTTHIALLKDAGLIDEDNGIDDTKEFGVKAK